MPPSRIVAFTTIVCHPPANRFVGTPEVDPQLFRLSPDAENKDAITQPIRYASPRITQSVIPAVAVDQQNHCTNRDAVHKVDVIRHEKVQDSPPTARGSQYLHLANLVNFQVKTVGYLAVGVVFGQDQDVW